MKTTTQQAPAERLKISASFKAFLERNYEDSRVARLIYTAAQCNLPAGRLIVTDALNYLTNRSDGMISYLPKGKECEMTEDGLWARRNRQEGKPARVINRLLSPHALKLLKQSEIEYFASLYNAATVLSTYARIINIKGEAIADIYRHRGSCINTCMVGHETEVFDIYTENPNVVGMLAMFDDRDGSEKLIGRALTWKIDGVTYVDRIYGANVDCIEYLKSYAMEQRYIVKQRQTYDDKDIWQRPDGSSFRKTMKVWLCTSFDKFPYLDTFTYGGDGWLSNDEDCDHLYKYTHTDGSRIKYVETMDGDFYPDDECRWSDYHDAWIHADNATHVDGDYYHENSLEPCTIVRVCPSDLNGDNETDSDNVEYRNGYRITDGSCEGDFVSDNSWKPLNRLL